MADVTESAVFRQKLYQNFKESGLLSKLKTTLRANLLQKLERPSTGPKQEDSRQKLLPFHLRHKFLESIIAQYLQLKGREYSLSIFQAECDLEQEDCLRYQQLSEITNLMRPAEGEPFLFRLMEEFGRIRCQQARQRAVQTDFEEPLSKKLDTIDSSFKAKIDYWKLIPNAQVTKAPDSLVEHEQKLRLQFNAEKERFKRELQVSLKQQIEKKYENQYLFRMREVQKAHEGRINEVKTREREILGGLERKKKDLQEKSKKIREEELEMINKYRIKFHELEAEHKAKMKQLEEKEKEFWKKELELRAKKRQYDDTIRLVKQKVIAQSSQ